MLHCGTGKGKQTPAHWSNFTFFSPTMQHFPIIKGSTIRLMSQSLAFVLPISLTKNMYMWDMDAHLVLLPMRFPFCVHVVCTELVQLITTFLLNSAEVALYVTIQINSYSHCISLEEFLSFESLFSFFKSLHPHPICNTF